MTLHSTNELRAINRLAVLSSIARADSVSRATIAQNTGLTLAAISRITRELIEAGVVVEGDEIKLEGAGRRTRYLSLSSTAASIVVMVISANRRAVGIANCRGEIVASVELPKLDLSMAKNAILFFCKKALSLIDATGIDQNKILGVSVVVAANTDPANNDSICSPVLEWKNIPAKSLIENALNLPVHLEARAVALLDTELWHRPAQRSQSIVLINNGWRLGSSVYVNNQLLQTSNARLGQIAHLPITGENSRCYCGQTGCLDSLASGAAIVNNLECSNLMKFDSSQPLNQRLSQALVESQNSADIAEVFRMAGEKLGEGLKSVVSLFSPERILIAGNTCRQSDYFFGVQERLRSTLEHHANCELVACNVSSIDAAVVSGLKTFLLTDSLNISRLIHSKVQSRTPARKIS
ncbi:MAG: ROK family transcriptional regulator [Pseudomonadales bacterium]